MTAPYAFEVFTKHIQPVEHTNLYFINLENMKIDFICYDVQLLLHLQTSERNEKIEYVLFLRSCQIMKVKFGVYGAYDIENN